MKHYRFFLLLPVLLATLSCPLLCLQTQGAELQRDRVVNVPGDSVYDFGTEPVRYLENDRIKLGLNMMLGGAVTYLEDKADNSGNMINSHDWGRQIQLSYYSGPNPYIGPNGEKPLGNWGPLGWNPIQSGDCGGFRSQVLAFEQLDESSYFLRARPMIWPHSGVPAECVFECRYQLVDNGFILDAAIINNRSDKTFYDVRYQETPALYTNAPWYKLISYLGDKPFENEPTTVIVDKNDQKGWPWTFYYTPERWSALVNADNYGVGVYQPFSTVTTAGFYGGDETKGKSFGEKDDSTGYIAPLETAILDWNIKYAYRAIFIVGSVDEIRSTVYEYAKTDIPKRPNWVFEKDRQNWGYVDATDEGYPIVNSLKINLNSDKSAIAQSPSDFWKAVDAPYLEINAAFIPADNDDKVDDVLTIQLYPVSPSDFLDATEHSRKSEAHKTDPNVPEYPTLPHLSKEIPIRFDSQARTIRVDLTDVDGYTGAMKQLKLVFPIRAGQAALESVRFLDE